MWRILIFGWLLFFKKRAPRQKVFNHLLAGVFGRGSWGVPLAGGFPMLFGRQARFGPLFTANSCMALISEVIHPPKMGTDVYFLTPQ